MATFTIALKHVLDVTGAGPENNYEPIGLGGYPIFDTDYRDELNRKIVNHYFNREIGMETIEMFSFAMKRKMNEIMPYYNQLYESERLKFNPLSTMDITTEAKSLTEEEVVADSINDTTSDTVSGSRSVQSTTPQTMLAGNEDYASSAADVTSDSDVASNSVQNSTTSGSTNVAADSRVYGYQGIPANLLMAYRASLLNIDLMVIGDIEDCFMMVWDNGDEYSQTSNVPYNLYMLGI